MVQAAYTAEALATLVANPQDRVAGVRALMGQMGATLDTFDYALGEFDVVATYTAPDDTTAAALALVVSSAGHIKSIRTTKLIAPDDFVAASQKAHGVAYNAPSRG
jgi:uncharacterized protein with GYD domain